MNGDPDDMLRTQAVADWLQVSPGSLAIWRRQGVGPPWVRVAERTIRYRRGDVADWLERQAGNGEP